jgi:hypothetical protein
MWTVITSFSQPHAHFLLGSSILICSTNHRHHIQHLAQSLPYTDVTKMTIQYILTLKMATAIFAEMLDSSQHPTLCIELCHENLKAIPNIFLRSIQEKTKRERI